jgi:hypothetical protein
MVFSGLSQQALTRTKQPLSTQKAELITLVRQTERGASATPAQQLRIKELIELHAERKQVY